MSEASNFTGHEPRNCGEHRTVGPHRAWCHDCGEWCYPESPCVRCEEPRKDALLAEAAEVLRGMHLILFTRFPTPAHEIAEDVEEWWHEQARPLLSTLEEVEVKRVQ